jgi:hypothetical protein
MLNENPIEDINKEQLLTMLTNFKKLHDQAKPSLRRSSSSLTEDDYISWYHFIRKIEKLESMEIFKQFNFSQDEKNLVTEVLKEAKGFRSIRSLMLFASKGIKIPE